MSRIELLELMVEIFNADRLDGEDEMTVEEMEGQMERKGFLPLSETKGDEK